MKAYFTEDFGPANDELEPTEWGDEVEDMQKFVKNNPYAIFPHLPADTQFTMLAKEFVIDGNEIDFIFVDDNGDFYIVETKLCTATRDISS